MKISPLGERVHLLRRRQGLTQAQLGAAVDVNSNTLARLERGEVQFLRTDRVIRIAKYFGVRVAYMLGMTPNEGSHEDDLAVMPAELAPVSA